MFVTKQMRQITFFMLNWRSQVSKKTGKKASQSENIVNWEIVKTGIRLVNWKI